MPKKKVTVTTVSERWLMPGDTYLAIGEIQVDQYSDNYKAGDPVRVTIEPITKEEYSNYYKNLGRKLES